MSKANKKHDPFRDMVDEMEARAEVVEETEPAANEPSKEAGADDAQPETMGDPGGESEPEPASPKPEEQPAAAAPPEPPASVKPSEPAAEAGGSEEPAGDGEADLKAELEAEQRRADALKDELAQMRAKARMAQAKVEAGQAPNPAAPQQPPAPTPGQAPAPAGQLPPSLTYENGQPAVNPAYIEALIEQRMQPDPRVEAMQREQQLKQQFVGFDEGAPERAASFSRADEAMDYFNLKMFTLSQQTGADLGALGIEGVLQTARDVGIMADMETHFPDVAPHLPDFLVAGTLPTGHGDLAMRNALSRFHESRVAAKAQADAAAPTQPVKPADLPNTAPKQVKTDRPPAVATVGSAPAGDNISSKAQREIELTTKKRDDPWGGLSDDEKTELADLRRELGL